MDIDFMLRHFDIPSPTSGPSRRGGKLPAIVSSLVHVFVLCTVLHLGAAQPLRSQSAVPYGIRPAEDSLTVEIIRHRMDSIRQYRPTVGLVLSGGGAKGAAHVGVLHSLEELHMPVDLVVGTSIGGLVGGIFAMGYNADDLEDLMTHIDWDYALSDKVDVKYIPYTDRKYRNTYLLNLPFYYSFPQFQMQKEADAVLSGEIPSGSLSDNDPDGEMEDGLHLGMEDRKGGGRYLSLARENIMGSLPSGFAFGQNVSGIISSLSVGYQDSIRFSSLPIPFACVATEMVTAKPKVWYGGKIGTALRSTMSIPGLFTPVKQDGMVLVDGGMRNNFPTDLARNLGADIIIGVDLSTGFHDYNELNNLMDIFSQTIDMFGRGAYEDNVKRTEVTVKPDLKGYDMLSFSEENIRNMLTIGYEGALKQARNLTAAKELAGPDTLTRQGPRAINLSERKVAIWALEIVGVSDQESRYLASLLPFSVDTPVGKEELDDAVSRIYATGCFRQVTYELLGDKEPFRLRFHCRRGPVHRLGIGARMDSEEMVAMLLNLGINVHNLSGLSLDLTGKVGTNPYFRAEGTLRSQKKNTFNLAAQVHYVDKNQFYSGDDTYKFVYNNFRMEAYASNLNLKAFDVKIGMRSDRFNIKSFALAREGVEGAELGMAAPTTYLSAFASGGMNNFDDLYFPSRGARLRIDYQWCYGAFTKGVISPFHSISSSGKFVAARFLEGRMALMPSYDARILLGDDIPLPFLNVYGGNIEGRYVDQQFPFIGMSGGAYGGNFLAIGRTELRTRLTSNNYISLIGNVAYTSPTLSSIKMTTHENFAYGFGLQYNYYSVAGPLTVQVHWSNITKNVGLYLAAGFNF